LQGEVRRGCAGNACGARLHLGAPKNVDIAEGDVIIAVGTKDQVAELQSLAVPQ